MIYQENDQQTRPMTRELVDETNCVVWESGLRGMKRVVEQNQSSAESEEQNRQGPVLRMSFPPLASTETLLGG